MFLKGHPAGAALAHTLQIILKIEYLQLYFVSNPNFLNEDRAKHPLLVSAD